MAVDADTGELYVTERNRITKVATDETVTTFKTGFSKILGLDVWHEPGTDYGAILVADNSAGAIKMIPLDNPSAPAQTVASGSVPRTVAWSRSSYSTQGWASSQMNRVTFANNTGGNIALWPAPSLIAEPYNESVHVWISAPDPDDKAGYWQEYTRESDSAATEYSTVTIKTWWKDGHAREICAMLGDAPTTAPYETKPTADDCSLPWTSATGVCDNQEPFDGAAGVGTSVDSNTFEDCRGLAGPCGTSRGDACKFEFRITNRYAGDNYRVYFYQPGTTAYVKSALVTAWKRVYVENDRMAQQGGMIWEKPNREPDAQAGDKTFLIAKDTVDGPPDHRMDNLALNDIIHIFDAQTPFEDPAHDIACVRSIDETSYSEYVLVSLGVVSGGTCTTDPYSLTSDYDGSVPNTLPPPDNRWDFRIGKSAGIAVEGAGFYEADPSSLDLPYDDAFVSFRLPKDGVGAVPYLAREFFDNHMDSTPSDALRHHQMWFKNKKPQAGTPEWNDPHNYFHLLAATGYTGGVGLSLSESDISWIFGVGIENQCQSQTLISLADCRARYPVTTTDHELAHQFEINLLNPCASTNLKPGHDPGGISHTANDAWCSSSQCLNTQGEPNERCLMSGDTQISTEGPHAFDGVDRMECEDLGIPNPNPCSTDDCGLGIRNQLDPR